MISPVCLKNTCVPSQLPAKSKPRRFGGRLAARLALLVLLLSLVPVGGTAADEIITFTDIAADRETGITWRRTPSTTFALLKAMQQEEEPIPFPDIAARPPMKPRGIPGLAIFDHDTDGDLDIYATNGPGTANSLYSSQLVETGELTFVDVGLQSGAAAIDQDSTGVVFGDIDNDGDHDLYVLGRGEPNRLFENQGDGTFVDITLASGAGAGNFNPMSACLGDVNADGLLDIFIPNSYSHWEDRMGVLLIRWDRNEHNQLLLNRGGNVFEDVSVSSGMTRLDWSGVPPNGEPVPEDAASASMACGMVDYDQDGDVDILFGDDQGGMPGSAFGGIDRGFTHLLANDGEGVFTDVMRSADTQYIGGWMGYAFGDYNHDGHMDFFGTNAGPYLFTVFNSPGDRLAFNSTWFLGQGNGSFRYPSVGDLVATPFGWGTATLDFDNDGDQDIVFHGSHDSGPLIEKSNPGTLLENDGNANFSFNHRAFSTSANHARRGVHGVATGDLDGDGFVDIVTSSNQDFQPGLPIVPFPSGFNSPFDSTGGFVPIFVPVGPKLFAYSGLPDPVNGTLTVEINSGNNGNHSVEVRALGTQGLTSEGTVNRDGIGAVVYFTPEVADGETPRPTMMPVTGGSSFASQNSLPVHFGLGRKLQGTVEVLWPGGVRNRLREVQAGERLVFPEIPCSFDDGDLSFPAYHDCVETALDELTTGGVLTEDDRGRFLSSALVAYQEAH